VSSIRRTLLVGLLAAVAVAGALVAFGVYRTAYEETNELFDYQLQQMGIALRDRIFEGGAGGGSGAEDFVIQVWRADGAVVFVSSARLVPVRAPVGLSTVTADGGDWRVYRIDAQNQIVQVAQPMSLRRDRAAKVALRVLLPLIVALPLLAALIWFVVGRGLAPLTGLARSVAVRGPGALEPLPKASVPDEVRPLVASLNDLLARLGRALDRERAFIGDAAHELRTPLAAVTLQLQVLERVPEGPERGEALARLKAGIERSARLVQQLLQLARQDAAAADRPMTKVDLAAVAREVVVEQAPQAQARGIDLGLDASPAELDGDAEGLRVALGNLVDNAVHYTPAGGKVDVRVRIESGQVVAEVVDTGPGIPAAERERVFDRFHRGGAGGTGSGLGLAIVREIARRHGATVELRDRDGGPGLCVRLQLGRGYASSPRAMPPRDAIRPHRE
jgi:two-component system OmpR family sensor kinase